MNELYNYTLLLVITSSAAAATTPRQHSENYHLRKELMMLHSECPWRKIPGYASGSKLSRLQKNLIIFRREI